MKFTTNLFGQILQITPRLDFYKLARKHKVEHNTKGFSSWDQYVAMFFCQLAQAKSLREISNGLAVTCGKLNHLGLQTAPNKSTLSYVNAHRPMEFYQDLFLYIKKLCDNERPGKKEEVSLQE